MKNFKKFVYEDGVGAVAAAPTNTTGSGQVAGMGQPPGSKSGEPGVSKKRNPMMGFFKRKQPKM
jgi:hypothetical protein